MFMTKKWAFVFMGMAVCSMVFWGCSEDQGKKQDTKRETTQERLGREAAQNLRRPIEDARKAAQLGAERVQTLNASGLETKPDAQGTNATLPQAEGKEKKKLEGC